MNRLFALLSLCLLVPLGACLTQSSLAPHPAQADTLTVARAVSAWEAVESGRVVGVVVEFHEQGGGRRFFSVRNAAQQELGMVDTHGRAWRYRPHSEQAEWLGSGTILEGASRILGLGEGVALYEVELERLRAESVVGL